MSKNEFRKILKHKEGAVRVSSVAIMMVIVGLSAMLVITPEITVRAAPGDFTNSKLITIESDYVDSTQTNFPVWVYNVSDDFKDSGNGGVIQPDGDDFAFYNYDNNTQYSHEIEIYDGATGTIGIWVNVSSVSSSADTQFWIYYGDADGTNHEDPANVWSEYVAVYHFDDASAELNDSTCNGFEMEEVGTPTYRSINPVTGGYCIDFTEETDVFRCNTDYGTVVRGAEDFGIFGIIKSTTDTDGDGNAIIYAYGETKMSVSHKTEEPGDPIRFYTQQGGTTYDIDANTNGLGSWYQFGVGYDYGTNMTIYLNGTYNAVDANTGTFNTDSDTYNTIGYSTATTERYFGGSMDEVHLLAFAPTGDWQRAMYYNTMDTENFLVFGASGEPPEEETASSVTLTGLDGDTRINWLGDPSTLVWSNATSYGTLNIGYNINSSDNCTEMRIYLDDIDTNVDADTVTLYVSSDNSNFAVLEHNPGNGNGVFPTNGGNLSISESTWPSSGAGTNPFPIDAAGWTNDTINCRYTCNIPAVSANTYTQDDWKVWWKTVL